MDDLLFQLHHIGIVDLFADHLIQTRRNGVFLAHGLHLMVIGHVLDLLNDLPIPGRRHLGTVLPVRFVSVVFRRVMACRDHDTGNAV